MITKLHSLKIINENTTSQVVNNLMCEWKDRHGKCYTQKCEKCECKNILFSEFDSENLVEYSEWITEKETRISSKTKKEIIVTVVKKIKKSCTTLQLVQTFINSCDAFLIHEMNIAHQFKAIKALKSKLSTKDLLINVDFSENYNCKYDREIQSVHFGASRQQISLHTGVAYSKDFKKAFSTTSPILDHNAPAVMAHLKPILKYLLSQCPEVEHLHLLSDSVSSQYRNKSMFFFISRRIPDLFPQLRSITWNYSESGHGKNAADGVGGTLKRVADEVVAQGNDINNYDKLMEVLQLKVDKIIILPIEEKDILEEQQIMGQHLSTVQTLKGTMKVHQACWSRDKERSMMFRSLSCYSCEPDNKCTHYHVAQLNIASQVVESQKEHKGNSDLTIGDWVVVDYEGILYPGEVTLVDEEGVEAVVMHRSSGKQYKWPPKEDKHKYIYQDILKQIEPPTPCNSRATLFTFKESF